MYSLCHWSLSRAQDDTSREYPRIKKIFWIIQITQWLDHVMAVYQDTIHHNTSPATQELIINNAANLGVGPPPFTPSLHYRKVLNCYFHEKFYVFTPLPSNRIIKWRGENVKICWDLCPLLSQLSHLITDLIKMGACSSVETLVTNI